MKILPLHDRYLLKKLSIKFLMYFVCLYSLYIIFDLSIRRAGFPSPPALFYFFTLSLRSEVFIPLAFLLSSIHTLLESNQHLEILSLQISGNNLIKITRVFFLFALILTFLGLLNFQIIYPEARELLEGAPCHQSNVKMLVLPDHSQIFYNNQLSRDDTYVDLFWVKSQEEVLHIHELSKQPPHVASGIDSFFFEEGKITASTTKTRETFEDLPLHLAENIPVEFFYKNLSLERLGSLLKHNTMIPLDTNQIRIHLYYKCVMAFMPFLVVTFLIPYAGKYYKNLPSIKIYGISLFVFILFYLIIKLGLVLADSELVSPFLVVVGFPLFLQSISLLRLITLR